MSNEDDELDLGPILIGLLQAMTDMSAGVLAAVRAIPATAENQELLTQAVNKVLEAKEKLDTVVDLIRDAPGE